MATSKSLVAPLLSLLAAPKHKLRRRRSHKHAREPAPTPPNQEDSRVTAQTGQPDRPRGAMGDVLTPTPNTAQLPTMPPPGAQAVQDSASGLKLPNNTTSPSNTSSAPDNHANSLQQPATMAAPAITVSHTANADPLDIFSEYLTTKTCFAFVLDNTLYDHRAATAAATSAILSAISDAHNVNLPDLESAYDDLFTAQPPKPHDAWPAYQKQLFHTLLSNTNANTSLSSDELDVQLEDLFRLYKKTLYAHLHPAPGVLPLMRSLLKRSARIVIAADTRNSHVTKDMAAWLVEHLYLDNFVDRIALLDDAANDTFADALKRLDVRPDETVLFTGAQRDARDVAAREGIDVVLVDAAAVEADARGRDAGGAKLGVKQLEDGVWDIGGLMVARNAVRMTLNERDRSVDSARI